MGVPCPSHLLKNGLSGNSDLNEAVPIRAPRSRPPLDVVPLGGATNLRHFTGHLGCRGLALKLSGLYGLAEERHFLGGLQGCAAIAESNRLDAERQGFFVCNEDLEDELIRAAHPANVVEVIAAEGATAAFRRLQLQPAQRGREPHAQL